MVSCGIDIGGTKIMIGLVESDGTILHSRKCLIPEQVKGDSFIPWLAEQLRDTLRQARIPAEEISFCGLGVPGTVSADGRTVLNAPNLGWKQAPIASVFETATGIPAKLVQDSRAGAWGEYVAGAGRGYKNVVCVTLGTGIGTGIVLNGQILHGSLLSAGEIGHVPVGNRGRRCGCGKTDCLEKYAAGLGLALTAQELYGETATTYTLFQKAKERDPAALNALQEAVEMLGRTLVSVVNLLSPDCLLFSGGLSEQQELYVTPLIEYIREHSYELTSRQLHIGPAKLGERAPMVGCALLPHEDLRLAPRMTASIMCADFMHLESELQKLEQGGVDYIHFDIMDNHFVPNLMIPGMLLESIRPNTSLPFDVHIMAENPEQLIPRLDLQEGDICSVHYESTPHLQRALALVRDRGAKAAVAINPGTPVEAIREVLPDVDMVLVMTVNPGYAGQKLIPQSLDKIQRMRRYLNQQGYSKIRIEVDGCCSFENIPRMRAAGADMFVLGTSSIYHADTTVKDAMYKIKKSLEGI